MKDVRKYLLVALAAIVLVTTASTSSLAIIGNNNNFSVPHKKVGIQGKKPQISAHHIVTPRGKKRNDYAQLNR